MAAPRLKIDHARFVVTVDPRRRIIQDGAIVVDGGRNERVGKAAELADARADRVIDARHLVVVPGFVNGHMHISYAHAVRGIFPDDLGSPLAHVFRLQAAMTEEEEHATSLLALVELLKNGTVCLLDPGSTKFPDACLQAYADSGIRVTEVRVDGGAAANDLLMQCQADVLGVPVVRPAITETTALGAAYLAGLGVGLWRDEAELDAQWRVQRMAAAE